MRTEIKELHERPKTTTVYVTHDQIEAMTMADKIVILRDGRIEQIGSPLEVYDHPANLFVASFIGSPAMNMLTGEIVKPKTGFAVKSGEVVLPLPNGVKAEPGRKVIYGIRPEHLDPVSGKGGIPAKVSVVEPTGPEIHIYADLGGEEICAITDERRELKRGTTIHLAPELDRIHLFDAESGQAIL
jgi:multiple sugar transport system ATP-binding protein